MATGKLWERAVALGGGALLSAALAIAAGGCSPAHSPQSDASNAAHTFNVATRFGQMGTAFQYMAAGKRDALAENRAQWGRELRVVDIEIAAMRLKAADEAAVLVDVTWVRNDETVVRRTRLSQTWRNPDGDWKLDSEQRDSGASGLLGTQVEVLRPPKSPDVHLPTRTLGK